MRRISAVFLILGLAISVLSAQASEPEKPRISLHWFDDRGQMVEVKWRNSARWSWQGSGATLEPTAELWIAVPEQIHVNSVDRSENASYRLVDAPDEDDIGLGQVLVVETRERKITAKLNIDSDSESEADKGLLIALNTDATTVLVHPSCAKHGLSLTRIGQEPGAVPFFVGVSCEPGKNKTIAVRFHLPEEDTLLDDAKRPVAQKTLYVSPTSTASGVTAFVLTKNDPRPIPYTVAFEKNPTPSPEKIVQTERHKKEETKPKTALLPIGLRAELSMAPAFVTYAASKNTGFDASAYNLDVSFRVGSEPLLKPFFWETELELPLVSFSPGPFHYPASGIYSLEGRASSPALCWGRDTTFRIAPGISLNEVHLEQRSEASGFVMGPEVAMILGGHTYEARASAMPLFGSGRNPFIHSYGFMGSFSAELSRAFFFGKRLDILAKLTHLGLGSDDGINTGVTNSLMGLQVWL